MDIPAELDGERYCYLTTQGRVTGRRHTAELWYVPTGGGAYLMSGSGGLTQWCLNLQSEERGVLRIGPRSWLVRASFVPEDDPDRTPALDAFHDKYDPEEKDRTAAWLRDATVVQMVLMRELDDRVDG